MSINKIDWESGYSEPPYFVNQLPRISYSLIPDKNKRKCKKEKRYY